MQATATYHLALPASDIFPMPQSSQIELPVFDFFIASQSVQALLEIEPAVGFFLPAAH